jgi:invasion protein IalB
MKYFLPVVALAMSGTPVLAQSEAGSVPSQISELYGDWTVSCGTVEERRECAVTQTLMESETSQHVLTLELARNEAGLLDGMLVVPFGMDFSKGVTLSVAAEAIGPALPFLTCLPSGCLVPVTISAAQRERLVGGGTLTVTGHSADGVSAIPIELSLRGFRDAVERLETVGE